METLRKEVPFGVGYNTPVSNLVDDEKGMFFYFGEHLCGKVGMQVCGPGTLYEHFHVH